MRRLSGKSTHAIKWMLIVSNLCLENNVVISFMFMDCQRYEHKNGPLLRNIRKEGVAV